MRSRILLVLLLLSTVLTACASPTPTPAPQPTAAAVKRSGTIRVSQSGSRSVRDVPALLAYESLRAMGYTVEAIPFAKTSLMPAALDKGDVDFCDASAVLISAAIAQGAQLQMISNKHNMSFVVIAQSSITDCKQLDGKPVGFSTRQSVGYVLFERFVAQHCPGINPEIMLVPESSNRMAGLIARQLTASYLDLQEWLDLQRTNPGEFHVLMPFATEFPDTIILPISVRREWAKQNPTIVHDYLRALLEAQRSVLADKTLLTNSIVKYLDAEPAQASQWADVYIKSQMWFPNGGLTQKNVEYTLSMLIDSKLVPAGLKPDDVADLSYLESVLNDIGRQ